MNRHGLFLASLVMLLGMGCGRSAKLPVESDASANVVDPTRIYLMGWSNGARFSLFYAISDGSGRDHEPTMLTFLREHPHGG